MRPIDADALCEWLRKPTGFQTNCEDCCEIDCVECIVDEAIRNSPTLDYAPVRHGAWMFITNYPRKGLGFFACSECGTSVELKNFNFCPNCGANMTIGGKEHDTP